jgi:hypothetical protein
LDTLSQFDSTFFFSANGNSAATVIGPLGTEAAAEVLAAAGDGRAAVPTRTLWIHVVSEELRVEI